MQSIAQIREESTGKSKTRKPNYQKWVWEFFPNTDEGCALLDHLLNYLFSYRYVNICKSEKTGNKWLTSQDKFKLSSVAILKSMLFDDVGMLGCRFGDYTTYTVIDIDAPKTKDGMDSGGIYHSVESVNEIRNALLGYGFVTVAYQSSKSGGRHLYVFFDKPQRTNDVAFVIRSILSNAGFVIADGNLEVFPTKARDAVNMGKGTRLPCQRGFSHLDQTTLDPIDNASRVASIIKFVEDSKTFITSSASFTQALDSFRTIVNTIQNPPAESVANAKTPWRSTLPVPQVSLAALEPLEQLEQKKDKRTSFSGYVFSGTSKSCMAYRDSVWKEGKQFYVHGLTSFGSRSHALNCVQHYLFVGDKEAGFSSIRDPKRRAQLMKAWLREKHNGFSEQINKGDPDAFNQIDRLVMSGWVEGKASKYAKQNAERKEDAEATLAWCLKRFSKTGVKNLTELHRFSKLSRTYLTEHRSEWEQLLVIYQQRSKQKKTAHRASMPVSIKRHIAKQAMKDRCVYSSTIMKLHTKEAKQKMDINSHNIHNFPCKPKLVNDLPKSTAAYKTKKKVKKKYKPNPICDLCWSNCSTRIIFADHNPECPPNAVMRFNHVPTEDVETERVELLRLVYDLKVNDQFLVYGPVYFTYCEEKQVHEFLLYCVDNQAALPDSLRSDVTSMLNKTSRCFYFSPIYKYCVSHVCAPQAMLTSKNKLLVKQIESYALQLPTPSFEAHQYDPFTQRSMIRDN